MSRFLTNLWNDIFRNPFVRKDFQSVFQTPLIQVATLMLWASFFASYLWKTWSLIDMFGSFVNVGAASATLIAVLATFLCNKETENRSEEFYRTVPFRPETYIIGKYLASLIIGVTILFPCIFTILDKRDFLSGPSVVYAWLISGALMILVSPLIGILSALKTSVSQLRLPVTFLSLGSLGYLMNIIPHNYFNVSPDYALPDATTEAFWKLIFGMSVLALLFGAGLFRSSVLAFSAQHKKSEISSKIYYLMLFAVTAPIVNQFPAPNYFVSPLSGLYLGMFLSVLPWAVTASAGRTRESSPIGDRAIWKWSHICRDTPAGVGPYLLLLVILTCANLNVPLDILFDTFVPLCVLMGATAILSGRLAGLVADRFKLNPQILAVFAGSAAFSPLFVTAVVQRTDRINPWPLMLPVLLIEWGAMSFFTKVSKRSHTPSRNHRQDTPRVSEFVQRMSRREPLLEDLTAERSSPLEH